MGDSIQEWYKENVDTVAAIDKDRHGWEVRLKVASPPPLDKWALILSDAIGQIRSSLDNFVFSTLTPLPASGTPKAPKLIKFPIAPTRGKWNSAKPGIAHLPQEYLDKIELWQPFQRAENGSSFEQDGLIWLSRLSNSDKHELQVKPQINPLELNHSFGVEFQSIEDAYKSIPPDVEIFSPEFVDDSLIMRQNTIGKIKSLQGEYQVTVRVEILIDGKYYGITGLLTMIIDYVAQALRSISGMSEDDWSEVLDKLA